MKRVNKWLITLCCIFIGVSCVACTETDDSDSTSNGAGNSSSQQPVIENVDFSARETVSYIPERASDPFVYNDVTYLKDTSTDYSAIGVNIWEKNVTFCLTVENGRTDDYGYFNLLASTISAESDQNMRYEIPGIIVYEDYVQFYNYWGVGATTFNVFAKNALTVETGVPYEITLGYGNYKIDGVIQHYKVYFKMTTINGTVLYDGIYTVEAYQKNGAAYDYSVARVDTTPSLTVGYWDGANGASHFFIRPYVSKYVIHYELPEGCDEELSQTEQIVAFGESFTLYTPNIEGFWKWVYKDGDKAGEEFVSGVYEFEYDVYLVAVIIEEGNQGEFDDNGGFTTPDVPNVGN